MENKRWVFLAVFGMAFLVFLAFIFKAMMFRILFPLLIIGFGAYLLYVVLIGLGFGDDNNDEDDYTEIIERD